MTVGGGPNASQTVVLPTTKNLVLDLFLLEMSWHSRTRPCLSIGVEMESYTSSIDEEKRNIKP